MAFIKEIIDAGCFIRIVWDYGLEQDIIKSEIKLGVKEGFVTVADDTDYYHEIDYTKVTNPVAGSAVLLHDAILVYADTNPCDSSGGGGGESLSATLAIGNTTSGKDIEVSAGDKLIIDDLTASKPLASGASKEIITSTDQIEGSFINSLTGKTTPVDADYYPLMDSADTNKEKKLSHANLKAVLKTYFDTLYANVGLESLDADYATTTALPSVTYLNGVSGVGATLTAVATGVVAVDGHNLALGDRILIKDQASTFQNGLYVVTIAGAIGIALVLTRSTEMNQAAEFNGALLIVINGTVNAGTFWKQTATVTTVGTDAVTFSQLTLQVTGYATTAYVDAADQWVKISSASASASATIDFTGLSGTYKQYRLEVYDLLCATSSTSLLFRIGTGGTPTYQAGATDYSHVRTFGGVVGTGTTAATTSQGDGNDTQITLFNTEMPNTLPATVSGVIIIYDPAQTAANHSVRAELGMRGSGGASANTYHWTVFGQYLSTTAVTAIRILAGSGNITSGTFVLYGLKA